MDQSAPNQHRVAFRSQLFADWQSRKPAQSAAAGPRGCYCLSKLREHREQREQASRGRRNPLLTLFPRRAVPVPTRSAMIYRTTGNLRAVQILLGHSKIENTVRYLGIDVEDVLVLEERIEI
jgi:hypothetical protein